MTDDGKDGKDGGIGENDNMKRDFFWLSPTLERKGRCLAVDLLPVALLQLTDKNEPVQPPSAAR